MLVIAPHITGQASRAAAPAMATNTQSEEHPTLSGHHWAVLINCLTLKVFQLSSKAILGDRECGVLFAYFQAEDCNAQFYRGSAQSLTKLPKHCHFYMAS